MAATVANRTSNPAGKALGTIGWDELDKPSSGVNQVTGATQFAAVDYTLYAADGTTNLWAYWDFSSTVDPVIIAPADGATIPVDPITGYGQRVTLAFEPLGTGQGLFTHWYVKIWPTAEGDAAATTSGSIEVDEEDAPKITMGSETDNDFTFTMMPNTEYTWKVKASNTVSGDGVDTGYSDTRTIRVQAGTKVQQTQAGIVLLGPQGGATTGLKPGFSWAPIAGATEYEFALATDAALSSTVVKTTVSAPAYQVTSDLSYDTTYFWGVKATKPTESQQSVGTFTTMAKPVPAPEPTPPVEIKEVPAPVINIPPTPPAPAPQMITPAYIWAVIIIGAILVIAVIVLIVRTRRPM
jgi:hypothetical protein